MVRRSKGLSDRHIKILELLQKHQDKGYPPSIREIGEQTEITSTSVVNYYLEQLEKWGYIERDRKISRGFLVTKKIGEIAGFFNSDKKAGITGRKSEKTFSTDNLVIPLRGRIVASAPVPVPASDFNYYDTENFVEIPHSLLDEDAKNLYALEVQGDSMIDAMVNDGDIVILRTASNATIKNGEMAAIWLPERDETTLKYYLKEKDHTRLQPANPTMKSILIPKNVELNVQGVVLMAIRRISPMGSNYRPAINYTTFEEIPDEISVHAHGLVELIPNDDLATQNIDLTNQDSIISLTLTLAEQKAKIAPRSLSVQYIRTVVMPYLGALEKFYAFTSALAHKDSDSFVIDSVARGSLELGLSLPEWFYNLLIMVLDRKKWDRWQTKEKYDIGLTQSEIKEKNASVNKMDAEKEFALLNAEKQKIENFKAKFELAEDMISILDPKITSEVKRYYAFQLVPVVDQIMDGRLRFKSITQIRRYLQ